MQSNQMGPIAKHSLLLLVAWRWLAGCGSSSPEPFVVPAEEAKPEVPNSLTTPTNLTEWGQAVWDDTHQD
jgi:hypothetical protein